MLCFFQQVAVVATVVLVMYLFNAQTRAPLLAIYRQRPTFYYFKVGVMVLLQMLRPRKKGEPKDVDCRQPLSSHPLVGFSIFNLIHYSYETFPIVFNQAIDAVYFNGSGQDGAILAIGTAQRKEKHVDGFIILRVSDFSDQVLVNLKFPDGWLSQTAAEEQDKQSWSVEGIKVGPSVAMQTWKLGYQGKMK